MPAVVVPDVPAALAALARAVLDRLPEITVVGMTGSSGKTSTKDLLAQLLAELGPTVAPPGSFNNELGHPYTVLRSTVDTRYLVLEKSARGIGHVAWLTRIARPRIGVVLNVGTAHLGEFGSRENIARAKGELVEALPADGVAVLNADDPLVLAMADRTAARVVTVGLAETADVRAVDVTLDERGTPSYELVTAAGSVPVHAGRARRAPGRQLAGRRRGRAGAGHAAAGGGRRARPGPGAVPVADGGHRAAGRGARRQRRLQRQPGVDGRGAAGADHDGPGPAVLGGARRDGRAGRVRGRRAPARRRARPPSSASTGSWSSGRRRNRCTPRRA